MNTLFILMAQFGPRAAVPVEDVRREYFSHLELDKFLEKVTRADIALPVTRVDKSRKSARFVSMLDLAMYLDAHMEEARREFQQMTEAAGSGSASKQRFAELMFARK